MELKLFPFYRKLTINKADVANPGVCEDWHVPVALVDLNEIKDDNWDITAARVAQFVDGVNHVKRIAELADADPALTRETIKHMLYYQVIMMVSPYAAELTQVDIFQYSNIYTVKPNITRLSADETIISECATYVTRSGFPHSPWPTLLRLYSKLQPGITIHDWVEMNEVTSLGIDPRRFVSFGIIKGFLRRVHRWPVLIDRKSPLLGPPDHTRRKVGFETTAGDKSGLTRSGPGDSTFTLRSTDSHISASPSSNRTPPSATRSPSRRYGAMTNMRDSYPRSMGSAAETHLSTGSKRNNLRSAVLRVREAESRAMEEDLVRFLDGMHHADEIQVYFRIGWKELERILGVGEVLGGKGKKGISIIYR